MTDEVGTGDLPGLSLVAESGEQCACFNLRKAARAVTQLYDEIMKPYGLKATQFSLLAAIKAHQPITVKRLAEGLVMDRTTLGRNLKPLEKKRLIRIETGEDKRERLVYMTERGQELLMKVYAAWKKAQYELLESLGDERLSRLLGDLSAVVKAARRAGEV